MAEGEDKSEKTEQPSQRKLQKAREKGDVPKSQEIPGWFVLAAGLGVIAIMSPSLGRALADTLALYFTNAHQIPLDGGGAMDLMSASVIRVALIMGLAFAVILLAGIMGHYVQQGLLFTAEKIKPKISKLNPVEGVKRILGPQGWMNFIKGVGKMGLVGVAIAIALWPRRDALATLPTLDMLGVVALLRDAAISLIVAALIVYALIALADYAFQRQQFIQRNKMSRKELRDEFKDTEGDPHVRAKLRQIRNERAQKRMMANVPDAAVIVTNPTHYAVALKYEQGITPAPICIAKGVDQAALRIREIAKEHDIPIVEDPPLARALHAGADIDEMIPVEHYAAVAKVIGYVLSLAGRQPG